LQNIRTSQDDSDTRQCRHHAFLSGCCRAGARHLYGRSITETHPITRIPTTWCHHLSSWDLYRSIMINIDLHRLDLLTPYTSKVNQSAPHFRLCSRSP
jgi:hypothetical protein